MRRRIAPLVAFGLLVGLVAAGAEGPPAPRRPVPIHADPAAVESGLVEALRAFIVGDGKAVRRALDTVEEGCRRLGPDEEPGYPDQIVNWDVAFHTDLDHVRELALRGDVGKSYDRYTFIPRGCTGCHADAVKLGLPGVPGPR